jgi:hypothetical protein
VTKPLAPEKRKVPKGMKLKARNIKFPPEWLEAIDALAAKHGVTSAEIVRWAVADYLDQDPDYGNFKWGQGRRGPLHMRKPKKKSQIDNEGA